MVLCLSRHRLLGGVEQIFLGVNPDELNRSDFWLTTIIGFLFIVYIEKDQNQRDAVLIPGAAARSPVSSLSRQPHRASAVRICSGIGAVTRTGGRFL